jgi:DNA helicase-2/ATP-dependent DNA helicase PcrA
VSIPSRFLEEVPSQLIENLSGPAPAWSAAGYSNSYGGSTKFGASRRPGQTGDFGDRHFNYEDESQEVPRLPASPGINGGFGTSSKRDSSKPFVAPWMTSKAKTSSPGKEPGAEKESAEAPHSIDNIARFFGGTAGHGKPGSLPRPAMELSRPSGVTNLKKGQRVRHAKYGEGTVLMREGEGEDAKLTVLFARHGMKKLMEKFANLQKI